MTRHVHFCNVGMYPEPPLAVCRSGYPIGKVYLVNSLDGEEYQKNEKEVRRRLESVGIHNIETIHVDPYDFEDVTEALEKAVMTERKDGCDCRFHFNITAGTNISAGAMCSLALTMSDADLYHLRKGEFCKPPSESDELMRIELADMESVRTLESNQKMADIMELICCPDGAEQSVLKGAVNSPSLLSYYLKKMSDADLIVRGQGRSPLWKSTEKGEKVYKRYVIRRDRKNGKI